MASTTGSSATICPFFIREYKRSITCEGMVEGEEVLHRFRSVRGKVRHQQQFCMRYGYGRCPYARMLEDKYREEDGKTGG